MPKRVEIDDAVLAKVDASCPKYLSPTGFVNLLLDQALTGVAKLPAYCVGAGTSSNLPTKAQPTNEANDDSLASKGLPEFEELSSPPLSFLGDGVGRESEGTPRQGPSLKVGPPPFRFVVPPDLEWCKEPLLTFWKEGKSGKKSKHAAALLFGGLRSISEKYGQAVVLEQLELATAKGFDNITLRNYEQFGVATRKPGASPAQAEMKHPAYKVFTAERGFDDGPTTNPMLEDLF
jgi:hypothetical protein